MKNFIYFSIFFLHTEFSKQAANGQKIERHIAPGEAKFVMELIQKHSTNYKVHDLFLFFFTNIKLKKKTINFKASNITIFDGYLQLK